MINMDIDTESITRLKNKFEKFGPYGLQYGLKATADYFNTPSFKNSMYPPSQSGQPFVWSSEKQRRFVMANIRLPSVRTFNLTNMGQFVVNKTSLLIEYINTAPYAKWVLHPVTMIIGHIRRGWKPVNVHVASKTPTVLGLMKSKIVEAWYSFVG